MGRFSAREDLQSFSTRLFVGLRDAAIRLGNHLRGLQPKGFTRARSSSEVLLLEALRIAERHRRIDFAKQLVLARSLQHCAALKYVTKNAQDDCVDESIVAQLRDQIAYFESVHASQLQLNEWSEFEEIFRLVEGMLGDFYDVTCVLSASFREEIDSFIELEHRKHLVQAGVVEGNATSMPHENALFGLALSGGGIRSASFSIGVIQAFSRIGILPGFDFISSVSGGGYAASWLAAWAYRHSKGIHGVANELYLVSGRESGPLRWVRRHSSYLAPKLEPSLSGDTWSLIVAYTVNWIPIFLFLSLAVLAILAVPRALVATATGWEASGLHLNNPFCWVAFIALVGLMSGIRRLTMYTRLPGDSPRYPIGLPQAVTVGTLIATTMASVSAGAALKSVQSVGSVELGMIQVDEALGLPPLWLVVLLVVFAVYIFSLLTSWVLVTSSAQSVVDLLRRIFTGEKMEKGGQLVRSSAPLLRVAVGLFVSYLSASFLLIGLISFLQEGVRDPKWLLAFGPLAFLAVISLSEMAGSLFTVEYQRDMDRAWVARIGGWMLSSILVWTVICFFSLWGDGLLSEWLQSWHVFFGAFVLVVMAFGLLWWLRLGYFWLWGGVALVAYLLVIQRIGLLFYGICCGSLAGWWADWLPVFSMAGATLLVASFLNVNRFSLHNLYKEGLVRTFLGASRLSSRNRRVNRFDGVSDLESHQFKRRRPDPITNIDDHDDPALAWLQKRDSREIPLVLFNAALNGESLTDLEGRVPRQWPFTFSQWFCGSPVFDVGYAATESIFSQKKGKGLTLGTAMAVSGAAVSPTSGRSTKALRAMLFGMLNARLGLWIGNPSHADAIRDESPRLAGFTVLREILGLRQKFSRWIHLSDGGHFENLGIYELLRRGCTRIVAVDASCDPDFTYSDFANAIRRAKIDLGIRICKSEKSSGSDGVEVRGWEWYDVDYGEGLPVGRLLYIKPSKHKSYTLPVEVVQYSKRSSSFPHETTADQFFSEAQMEAYRALGYAIGFDAMQSISKESSSAEEIDVDFIRGVILRVFSSPLTEAN